MALIGPNGAGKTTLLETLLGRRDPAAGKVRFGHGVEPAYFSQHEVELDERGSVLEATMAATGLRRTDAQSLLGRFLFSGWDAHEKPVAVLSGGERRRLALALVVASGANFLVLDEPTNHLDVESREALEAALEAFPGTVLLVTHDRALLDAVSGRVLAIEDGASPRTRAAGPSTCAATRRPRPPPPKPKSASRSRSARRARTGDAHVARARRARDRRAARSAWPSWSGSSPRTGRTSISSRPTVARATTSRRCSRGGRRCSRKPRPDASRGSAAPLRTCPFRPRGLPTSRPYAIEPNGEIVTCL